METKKTLYIGAHPDDVLLGAGITISRNPKDANVLIMSNGATLKEEFPAKHGLFMFDSYRDFAKKRLEEDRSAMEIIGLDMKSNYRIIKNIPTENAYKYIQFYIDKIREISKEKGIEKIVTHIFAEAHPDHDIANFCSHYVAKELGLDVWEYPLYYVDENGKEISQEFKTRDHDEFLVNDYSPDEIDLKKRLMNLYESQIYIVDMFTADRDQFGRIRRDFTNMPGSIYWYKDMPCHPNPETIREAIKSFISKK
jgi:LmbE family N-acetylglucosaminyl deacetylase